MKEELKDSENTTDKKYELDSILVEPVIVRQNNYDSGEIRYRRIHLFQH